MHMEKNTAAFQLSQRVKNLEIPTQIDQDSVYVKHQHHIQYLLKIQPPVQRTNTV